MAYLCFYSAEGRGKGGRRLNSIYSSVVFRKEREIEFMKRCEWKRERERERSLAQHTHSAGTSAPVRHSLVLCLP